MNNHEFERLKKSNPNDWKVVYIILAALTIPVLCTLMTVEEIRPREPVNELAAPNSFPNVETRELNGSDTGNPSPRGYTWSLTLWSLPAVALGIWLVRTKRERFRLHKAVVRTIMILAGIGAVLDFFFGLLFFTFPNEGSFGDLRFPALDWDNSDAFFNFDLIPLEELGFYLLGVTAIVLCYVWCDEYWFAAYNIDDKPRERRQVAREFRLHWKSGGMAFFILALGWLYRIFFAEGAVYDEGWPAYLTFLTVLGLAPSMILFKTVESFINYRALSLTLVLTLFICMFYEAVLAVPYQWWGFNEKWMIGISIHGFSGVPIEEPLLWISIVWATVIFFEFFYTIEFHGWRRTAGETLEYVRERTRQKKKNEPRSDSLSEQAV